MTPQPSSPPTNSTSNLCSLAADLAVNQILRVALPLGEKVFDTSVEFCGFTNRCVTSRLPRNPACPVSHAKCSLRIAETPLSKSTLAELSKVAALTADSGVVTFAVDGYNWIEFGRCQCTAPKPARRFAPLDRTQLGLCSNCKSPILAQPIFTHRAVSASLLGDALEQPLRKLGAARARCVLIGNGDQSILFREPNPQLRTS